MISLFLQFHTYDIKSVFSRFLGGNRQRRKEEEKEEKEEENWIKC